MPLPGVRILVRSNDVVVLKIIPQSYFFEKTNRLQLLAVDRLLFLRLSVACKILPVKKKYPRVNEHQYLRYGNVIMLTGF